MVQVYANAGGALIMVLLGEITGNSVFDKAALITFVAAFADTVSSEIGMLSKSDPVSIITFKKIQQGLSGGVSILGIAAAIFASLLFSLILVRGTLIEILFVVLLGSVGSMLDSLLGAVFQAKYYLDEHDILTEMVSFNNRL